MAMKHRKKELHLSSTAANNDDSSGGGGSSVDRGDAVDGNDPGTNSDDSLTSSRKAAALSGSPSLPQHHQHHHDKDDESDSHRFIVENDEYMDHHPSKQPQQLTRGNTVLRIVTGGTRRRFFILCFCSVLTLWALVYTNRVSKLNALRVSTCFPIVTCAYIAFIPSKQQQRPIQKRILPGIVVVTVLCGQLPSFLGSAIAASTIVMFSLFTSPPKSSQQTSCSSSSSTTTTSSLVQNSRHNFPTKKTHIQPMTIILSVVLLVTVMLTENFLIWVVSATFEPGHNVATAPPPLQDNGQIVLRYLLRGLTKREVVSLRRLWNVQWSLVACLGGSFLLADVFYHPRRQLFSIALRGVLTLAVARFIRTVSFLLTVVPSQNKACYQQHFPNPPPSDPWEWIQIGFIPSSHGGCNDLIISGHATVTSMMACTAASTSEDPIFQTALWTLVILDYIVEIYEGFHYSVDMWLGCILVCLIWRVLQPVEICPTADGDDKTSHLKKDTCSSSYDVANNNSTSSIQRFDHKNMTKRDVILYAIPAVIAYITVNAFSRKSTVGNLMIVVFVGSVTVFYIKFVMRETNPFLQQEYQHHAQNAMLCLIYLAMSVYL